MKGNQKWYYEKENNSFLVSTALGLKKIQAKCEARLRMIRLIIGLRYTNEYQVEAHPQPFTFRQLHLRHIVKYFDALL